jgi:hypothetical protein
VDVRPFSWPPSQGWPRWCGATRICSRVGLPALLDLPDGLSLNVRRDIKDMRWRNQHIWLPVLNEHFRPGHPVRDRILDRVLELLAGDVTASDATDLHRFLGELAATTQELVARRRLLFGQVASRVPRVVSHAVWILAWLCPPASSRRET